MRRSGKDFGSYTPRERAALSGRSRRRGRSARSYAVEVALRILAVLVIWLALANGAPKALGDWIAGQFIPS